MITNFSLALWSSIIKKISLFIKPQVKSFFSVLCKRPISGFQPALVFPLTNGVSLVVSASSNKFTNHSSTVVSVELFQYCITAIYVKKIMISFQWCGHKSQKKRHWFQLYTVARPLPSTAEGGLWEVFKKGVGTVCDIPGVLRSPEMT